MYSVHESKNSRRFSDIFPNGCEFLVNILHDQVRLSLSTDGDKCAMVNFGGMNKMSLKHVFALYSLPIIFSKNFLARYALDCVLSSAYKCKHAMCFTNSIYIYFFIFWCHYP